jgi:hypothetical protein
VTEWLLLLLLLVVVQMINEPTSTTSLELSTRIAEL